MTKTPVLVRPFCPACPLRTIPQLNISTQEPRMFGFYPRVNTVNSLRWTSETSQKVCQKCENVKCLLSLLYREFAREEGMGQAIQRHKAECNKTYRVRARTLMSPVKKNDGELNKSVSVQGNPCLTLLQEMQEMWGGGRHRVERGGGGSLQDAATSFGAQSRMRR